VPDNRTLETRIESGRLTATGKLHSNGLQFETQIQFVNQGGELTALDNNKIRVANADSLVILINAGTDYAQQYPRYRAQHPHKKLQKAMDAANKKNFAQIQNDHRKDYQSLFNRVKLDLGQGQSSEPTATLLKKYKTAAVKVDRTLEATYFQFDRYLLIATSR